VNYPPPPYQPGSNIPPPGGYPPAPGGYAPLPPGQQGGYLPPAGQPPQPGYPSRDPYGLPPPQAQRRGGCKGCFFGCLIAFFATIVVIGVIGVAGVYMVKSMFPSNLSFGDAAGCAVMRTIVNNADTIIDQTDASAADKADMRRGVQEVQAEYERQCGVQRLY
jgi:hypothetical protein